MRVREVKSVESWRIRQEIGRGGMSVVFLAVDEISNQKYAVKEIRPDGKEELAILRKSLEHEAEILRELSHPGIVRLEAVVPDRDGILLFRIISREIHFSRFWMKGERSRRKWWRNGGFSSATF